MITLPETNIAPKNGWLEYYFPIGEAYFQGRNVSFREGSVWVYTLKVDQLLLLSVCLPCWVSGMGFLLSIFCRGERTAIKRIPNELKVGLDLTSSFHFWVPTGMTRDSTYVHVPVWQSHLVLCMNLIQRFVVLGLFVTFQYSITARERLENPRSLGGGFKYFLISPLFGEDSHFDDHIFQMGGSTTN